MKSLSNTIYRPDTPGGLDHRPPSRQKSFQCVQGTDTSTAVERFRIRFTWEDLQPDCSADRPVTGPHQPT
eukprot:1148169-Pelagomonas_calceolata.AAC.1